MTTQRQTSSAKLKEQLEIKKIRTDTLFVKLTFVAQLLNPLTIAAVGVAVLYLFQRPQIEQMEASRLLNEKQQISAALERAVTINSPAQRAITFKVLKELWPQYEAITVAEESRNLLDLKPPAAMKENCAQILGNLSRLEQARNTLKIEIAAEVSGLRGSLPGTGPIAKVLKSQLAEIDTQLEKLRNLRAAALCF